VRVAALIATLAWLAHVLREAWLSGELDRKTLALLVGLFIIAGWLSYGSRGTDMDAGTCGAPPTTWDC